MEKEVLVSVQNVSKKFSKNLKSSLKYGASDIIKSSLGFKIHKELRKDEFWAVKDVSFELKRGECIGLIGHNGAGKSTLLKILNGLYNPDKGQIVMKGKIGALIELGAGFNPILTGRENIYNNASILGFTKKEVEEKIQSIINFSELEEFIDMPVQNYSSGMKVRLGFAVAAHLEPDVLIIDEVLAVGDLGFALKCYAKIDEILPKTAIIFVSHSMPMISRMCNQVVLMNSGCVEYQGFEVAKGILYYYNNFNSSLDNNQIVFDDKTIAVEKIKILNDHIQYKDDIKIMLSLDFLIKVDREIGFNLIIKDKEQRAIASTNEEQIIFDKTKDKIDLYISIYEQLFTLGIYSIDLIIYQLHPFRTPVKRVNNIIKLKIEGNKEQWVPILLKNKYEIL